MTFKRLKTLCAALLLASLPAIVLGDGYLNPGGGGGGGGSGTVTNVATTSPIGGGPISTTGTLTCTTCTTNASALTANSLVKGAGGQATAVSALTDDGAGAVGWYPASSTPQAVTQTYASGSGTDISGAASTIRLSGSTGTGLGGTLAIQNTNKATTGGTANTYGNVLTLSPPNTGTTPPVNYLDIKNAITAGTVALSAAGSDTNVAIELSSKGTGNTRIRTAGGASILFLGGSSVPMAIDTGPEIIKFYGGAGNYVGWVNGDATGAADTFIGRRSAANLRLGTEDAASPTAQTISLQGPRGGTDSNANGVNLTFAGSVSTGTGLGGSIIFTNTNKATTGSTANTAGNVLTLTPPNTGTTAPVNYLDVKNAITGSGPSLTATGTDTNIPITLLPKGSGTLIVTNAGATGGTAANPLLGINNATTGLFNISEGLGFVVSSTNVAGMSGTAGLSVKSNLSMGFSSGTPSSAANDAFFNRAGAAASIQMGADGTATPASQTFGAANATGGTDQAGGVFTIKGSTGSGAGVPGRIAFQTSSVLATGTTQQTQSDRFALGIEKVLTNNTVTAMTNMTMANNTVVAAQAIYSCQVFNGTDLQIEEGEIVCHATNKSNTPANNTCVKFGNQQAMTSGTVTVTWTITAANPAVVSVNCNSSLTPSTGYPKLRYAIHNLTDQAMAIQ